MEWGHCLRHLHQVILPFWNLLCFHLCSLYVGQAAQALWWALYLLPGVCNESLSFLHTLFTRPKPISSAFDSSFPPNRPHSFIWTIPRLHPQFLHWEKSFPCFHFFLDPPHFQWYYSFFFFCRNAPGHWKLREDVKLSDHLCAYWCIYHSPHFVLVQWGVCLCSSHCYVPIF